MKTIKPAVIIFVLILLFPACTKQSEQKDKTGKDSTGKQQNYKDKITDKFLFIFKFKVEQNLL